MHKDYLNATAIPQVDSKESTNVKYHYEGLKIGGPLKNYGITAEELQQKNYSFLMKI